MDFLGGSAAGFRREMDCDYPAELPKDGQGHCQIKSDPHLPADSQSRCQDGLQSDSRSGSQSGLQSEFDGGLRGEFYRELRESCVTWGQSLRATHLIRRGTVPIFAGWTRRGTVPVFRGRDVDKPTRQLILRAE
jgi:hypothetical protein